MTNQQHPITPPPELVQQWFADWESSDNEEVSFAEFVVPRAAQWGADQELEACCKELEYNFMPDSSSLRAARRPKPPSLKEQALETLKYPKDLWSEAEVETIRLALEELPE